MSPQQEVLVVADAPAVAALEPLLQVWRGAAGLRLVPWSRPDGSGPPADLGGLASTAAAVLVVGPRCRAPRTVLPGPCLWSADGRPVPVAWLPFTSFADVRRFAVAASRRHAAALRSRERPGGGQTLMVLGERQPRFDRLAERVMGLARAEDRVLARRCTAYELTREDCVAALSGGPALAVYLGHGRPTGWVGYAGMRAHHLAAGAERPDHRAPAAIVSLTCRTASRRRTGLSFAEAVVTTGAATASLGAVHETRHTGNARWAVRIARDLAGTATIGDLVARLAAGDPHADAFRLVGDPTAPLVDAPPGTEDPAHPPRLEEAS